MKSTGIVRKIDELGRVVIPKELRRSFSINEGDPMEIYTSNDAIILKKFIIKGECLICGSDRNIKKIHGKYICKACCTEAIEADEEEVV